MNRNFLVGILLFLLIFYGCTVGINRRPSHPPSLEPKR